MVYIHKTHPRVPTAPRRGHVLPLWGRAYSSKVQKVVRERCKKKIKKKPNKC